MIDPDDELARRLSSLSPARTALDAVPDAAARRLRDEIMAGTPRRRPTRARVLVPAAAALVALVAVTLFVVLPATPIAPAPAAVAITPDPLKFTGSPTLAQVQAEAARLLQTRSGPSAPERTVRTVSWSLAIDADLKRAEVVPQVSTLIWQPDGSGSIRVVAGEPYWPAGADRRGASASPLAPGDVITDMTFDAGQYTTPVAEPPGDSAVDVAAMLRAYGVPEGATGADVVTGIVSALGEWTLTNAQHQQLISMLVNAEGVTSLGNSTDRVGRPVWGLEVTSSIHGTRDTLLISQQTGRIVGYETQAIAGSDLIPRGAIISYRIWDTNK